MTATEAPLRFLRLWQTLGVLLIGFVVYLSLMPDPIQVPVEQGDKYGHILASGHADVLVCPDPPRGSASMRGSSRGKKVEAKATFAKNSEAH